MATVFPHAHPALWQAIEEVAHLYVTTIGGTNCRACEAVKARSYDAPEFSVVDLRLADVAVAALHRVELLDLIDWDEDLRHGIGDRNPWLTLALSIIESTYAAARHRDADLMNLPSHAPAVRPFTL